MAYHLLAAQESDPKNLIVDVYLGTATFVDTYWESVGRELALPISSSIVDRADSEEGFTIKANELLLFLDEINKIEEYWRTSDGNIAAPEEFFENIKEIKDGVKKAIREGVNITIG